MNTVKINTEISGQFKFESFKGVAVLDCDGVWRGKVDETPGTRKVLADWFPNLITDYGLNIIGTSGSYTNECHVGSGSTKPNVLDTALDVFVAGNPALASNTAFIQSTVPYYGTRRKRYRFAEGDAAGNLAEVGVSNLTTNGNLFSRALILDSNGDPVPIVVLPTEFLDVTYDLRIYPPLVDVDGAINISGVDHTTLTRACLVTNVGYWANGIGQVAGTGPVGNFSVFNGSIGPITSQPSGASDNDFRFTLPYSNNSLYSDFTYQYGLNDGNLAGGILAILFYNNYGSYQMSIDPAIDKTNVKTLDLTFRVQWASRQWAFNWAMQAASNSVTPTTGNWNTNLAQTLLRINWTDSDTNDQQNKLQVDPNCYFRISEIANLEKVIQYRVVGAWTEGADWTEYTVTVDETLNGGPAVGAACEIKSLNDVP